MERIIEHIERLLQQHDCVIIPDFGGFVLQSISADYLEESHLFTPSRKEIVFNMTLTHNDGLLVESYMKQYSIDFAKAVSLIRNDVATMKNLLNDNSELQLGVIGMFFKNDGYLIFRPDKHSDELLSLQSYGLPFFNFLPLTARHISHISVTTSVPDNNSDSKDISKKNSRQGEKIIFNIPVTRIFLQILGATAAAMLLFLILPTPVNDVNIASYTASFVPQEIMPKKLPSEIVADAFSKNNNDLNLADGYVTESVISPSEMNENVQTSNEIASITVSSETKTNVASSSVAKPEPKPEPSPDLTTSNSTASKVSSESAGGMKYYVIIGSYNTKTRAQTHINQLNSNEKANAGIVVQDGHVRVYAQYFSSEKDALSYRAKLRQNPKYSQAWIHKGP